jgi:adenylate cyclase
LNLRRRLAGPEARLDFPILKELAAGGASDYFAEVVRFGEDGDPSHGTGIGYSFATDRPGAFATMTSYCCGPCCPRCPSR